MRVEAFRGISDAKGCPSLAAPKAKAAAKPQERNELRDSSLRFPIRLRRGLGFGFRCCGFLGLAILGLWFLDLDLGASCRDFVGLGCHP